MRQIVLDTETTGINKFGLHYEGHRIIEIGAVEIIDRCLTNKKFHTYLNPNRLVDLEAFQIHGISDQFLLDKPVFSEIIDDFLRFINGSELIIHNASFDLGFLNYELKNYTTISYKKIESYCTIIDSLKIARKMFPGQRNSLDALCERYAINNKNRLLHNALLDAQILAYVFLCMTGGQTKINFAETSNKNFTKVSKNFIKKSEFYTQKHNDINNQKSLKSLKIIYANIEEKIEHKKYLDHIEKINKKCIWKEIN